MHHAGFVRIVRASKRASSHGHGFGRNVLFADQHTRHDTTHMKMVRNTRHTESSGIDSITHHTHTRLWMYYSCCLGFCLRVTNYQYQHLLQFPHRVRVSEFQFFVMFFAALGRLCARGVRVPFDNGPYVCRALCFVTHQIKPEFHYKLKHNGTQRLP